MFEAVRYKEVHQLWPREGRHILASYDEDSILVYQAYKPDIGEWAVSNQRLGGPGFKMDRMSWIKPNFLWMMYRSGWGTKKHQEVTLGFRIARTFFDELLAAAVASGFRSSTFDDKDAWQAALRASRVRLQWDPDHHPSGAKLNRRAVQLGLRGSMWERFVEEETIEILDLSDFVDTQRRSLHKEGVGEVLVPNERVYWPGRSDAVQNIGLEGHRREECGDV